MFGSCHALTLIRLAWLWSCLLVVIISLTQIIKTCYSKLYLFETFIHLDLSTIYNHHLRSTIFPLLTNCSYIFIFTIPNSIFLMHLEKDYYPFLQLFAYNKFLCLYFLNENIHFLSYYM